MSATGEMLADKIVKSYYLTVGFKAIMEFENTLNPGPVLTWEDAIKKLRQSTDQDEIEGTAMLIRMMESVAKAAISNHNTDPY